MRSAQNGRQRLKVVRLVLFGLKGEKDLLRFGGGLGNIVMEANPSLLQTGARLKGEPGTSAIVNSWYMATPEARKLFSRELSR